MTSRRHRTRRRATVTTAGRLEYQQAQYAEPLRALAHNRSFLGLRPQALYEPGNTTDTALIRQARADLRETTLARVVWVGDRGFTSAANRRELRAGGHGYILGERLRSGSAEATAALARPDRYRTVADNLQVKEVHIAEDERFVVCYNPEAADRDAALRQVMVAKLTELIAGSDKLSERKRAEPAGQLSTMPALRCYLR
ncbi:MAG: hypothetical protein JF630_12620, partial [Geodermatophilales bacterium]|nr:hypothetical protein [Geodermatophilales bacterium]